eukprot:COSAG05_NODE_1493_length_4715_cov_4.480069_2_plen_144_part_01
MCARAVPCLQSSTCQADVVGAAVRCCADTVVGPTTCDPRGQDDDTVTVYIINAQGQCGESTIPSDWAQLGLGWISEQGLTATVGTCASMGYTVPAGSQVLQGTGAPTDPTVTFYTFNVLHLQLSSDKFRRAEECELFLLFAPPP